MVATICRKVHFSAAHRLHNSAWNLARNAEVFGKCNNANYHGHNYELIVKVAGEIDSETGFVMDVKLLKGILENEITDKFDHKNLNLDTEEFKEINPTAENMAMVIYNLLRSKIDDDKKLGIILYETERNYVEYNG